MLIIVADRRVNLARYFAVRVVRRDPHFALFTIGVCGIAATVACFQFAVFMSFLRAGAVVPRMLGGKVWIVARGVACFDFPTPFSEDYQAALLRYFPDARSRRVAVGFSSWRSPLGGRASVAVVGVERQSLAPTEFIADRSDLARLGLGAGGSATIGGTSLTMARSVASLPTFLGAPYVLADFDAARRLLGLGDTQASFILLDLPHGLPADFTQRQAAADRAFPEVELVTGEEFARRSSLYWQAKTGAGAAILLAAALAALLMVVLLVNSIGRFVQRYEQDLLSLIGHGADDRQLIGILIVIAGLLSLGALGIALVAGPIVAAIAQPYLPWVYFRLGDMWWPSLAVTAGFAAALLSARRAITRIPADAIFRI